MTALPARNLVRLIETAGGDLLLEVAPEPYGSPLLFEVDARDLLTSLMDDSPRFSHEVGAIARRAILSALEK